jgi:hypothetical protein
VEVKAGPDPEDHAKPQRRKEEKRQRGKRGIEKTLSIFFFFAPSSLCAFAALREIFES